MFFVCKKVLFRGDGNHAKYAVQRIYTLKLWLDSGDPPTLSVTYLLGPILNAKDSEVPSKYFSIIIDNEGGKGTIIWKINNKG
jgi:hypothetical protein